MHKIVIKLKSNNCGLEWEQKQLHKVKTLVKYIGERKS